MPKILPLSVPALLAGPAGALLAQQLGGVPMEHAIGAGLAASLAATGVCLATWRGQRSKADVQDLEACLLAAEDNRRKLEDVMDSMADGVLVTDSQGSIISANPAACRLLGLPPDDLYGQAATKVLGLECTADMDEALRKSGSVERVETVLPAPAENGRTVVQFSSALLLQNSGEPVGAVYALRDVTEQKQGERLLARQALRDELTGLPNRLGLLGILEKHLEAEPDAEDQRSGCLIMLGLDRFRRINQAFGRNEADRILAAMANRLVSGVRGSDTIARTGGDEFAIFLPEVEERSQAEEAMERLLATINRPLGLAGREHSLTARGGLAMVQQVSGSCKDMMEAAESAMLCAKEDLSAGWMAYRPAMRQEVERYAALEQALRECLDEESVEVVYQPVVDAQVGSVVGLEALARINHPLLGTIPPEEFISLAEESGLIAQLGRLIRRRAVSQFLSFDMDGMLPTLHLNVTATELVRPDFADDLLILLEDHSVPSHYITIEVAEAAVADDPEAVAQVLAKLKSEGISIALDDYGVGYLSISALSRLPLDAVKLHNSLITGAKYRLGSLKLARGLSSLARHLRVAIMAEGVETLDDLEIVHTLGCNMYQGFFFAGPMPAAELMGLLDEMRHFTHIAEENLHPAQDGHIWKM